MPRLFWSFPRYFSTAAVLAAGLLAPHAAKAADPGFHLWVDDPETQLQRLDDGEQWTVLCKGRCDRMVPVGIYRLTEKSGAPLSEFYLDASNARELWVRPNRGKSNTNGVGILSVAVGSVGLVVTAFMTMIDSLHCLYTDPYGDPARERCEREQPGLYLKDAVAGAVSVAVLVTGVAFLVSAHRQSPLVFFTSRPDPPPAPGSMPGQDRSTRPAWLSGGIATPAHGAASAFTIPILSGHF